MDVVYKAEWWGLIETNWKMKTSVALLTFSLFYLCVAEVQQLENPAGVCNNTQIHNIEIVLSCAGGTIVSQGNCEPVLNLNKPETKVKNAEEQSRGLHRESQGKTVHVFGFMLLLWFLNILIKMCFHVMSQATREAFQGVIGATAIGDEPFLTEVTLTHKSGFPESETFYPTKGNLTVYGNRWHTHT